MKKILFLFSCSLFFTQQIAAQAGVVRGAVRDNAGKPMIGVMVTDPKTGRATVTDVNGEYAIMVTDSNAATLRVRYGDEATVIDNAREAGKEIKMKAEAGALKDRPRPTAPAPRMAAGAVVYSISDEGGGGGTFREYGAPVGKSMDVKGVGGDPAIRSGRLWTVDGIHYSATMSDAGLTRNADGTFGEPRSGLLTAGEINDFGKWNQWGTLHKGPFKAYAERLGISPKYRYAVQVTTPDGYPVFGATAILKTQSGEVLWQGRTDNTGKAELWMAFFGKNRHAIGDLRIEVAHLGEKKTIRKVIPAETGLNRVTLKVPCGGTQAVDMAFLIDATGSMDDEMAFIKAELVDVMQRLQDTLRNASLRIGNVFYRDHAEEYLTLKSDFTSDFDEARAKIHALTAENGGDTPEAVDEGLLEAVEGLSWRPDAVKVLFLVLDAAAHFEDPKVKERLEMLTMKAAALGIRIVPVACSGIDQETEFYLRSLALATNGTYTFLTDHSGIGNPHQAPQTDVYAVELLNTLVPRIVTQYAWFPACAEEAIEPVRRDTLFANANVLLGMIDSNAVALVDKNPEFKVYPNPTNGPLFVEANEDVTFLFLTDLNGKILERFSFAASRQQTIDISAYPNGVYLLRCPFNDQLWVTARVVLTR